MFGLNAFYSKMVGIGLGSAVGGYIGKELIADKKDSRNSNVYAVIGGLIGGFAPELKASIGDGLRNLANLGKVFSDAGEVIGDVGELYASTRSGVAFFESVGESDIIQPSGGTLALSVPGV